MKIEVVEFYPISEEIIGKKIGTLHVFVDDLNMDIRGINVFFDHKLRKNEKEELRRIRFFMPNFLVKKEGGRIERYPLINFTKPGLNKKLILSIQEKGSKYVLQNYKPLAKFFS